MRWSLCASAAVLLATLAQPADAQATFQRAPGALAAPTARLAPPDRFAPLALARPQMRQLQRLRTAQLDFACNPVACVCRGDLDCNDMFGTNVCGERAICIDGFCYCSRR